MASSRHRDGERGWRRGVAPVAWVGFIALAEVAMGFSPRERMPQHLIWQFTVGPRLQRDGAYVALTRVPVWNDPQRPPPADFDTTPQTVLITEDDFAAAWQQIARLDLRAYAHVPADAVRPLPPDVAGPERLRVEVEGRVQVDFLRESEVLVPEWRQALLAIARELDGLFERRLADPLLPRDLVVRVERTTTSAHAWAQVVRAAGQTRAEARAGAAPVSSSTVGAEAFADLWRWMLAARLADRTFAPTVPAAAGPPPRPVPSSPPATAAGLGQYVLESRIDGHPLADVHVAGEFDGRTALDELLARLQALAKP